MAPCLQRNTPITCNAKWGLTPHTLNTQQQLTFKHPIHSIDCSPPTHTTSQYGTSQQACAFLALAPYSHKYTRHECVIIDPTTPPLLLHLANRVTTTQANRVEAEYNNISAPGVQIEYIVSSINQIYRIYRDLFC